MFCKVFITANGGMVLSDCYLNMNTTGLYTEKDNVACISLLYIFVMIVI